MSDDMFKIKRKKLKRNKSYQIKTKTAAESPSRKPFDLSPPTVSENVSKMKLREILWTEDTIINGKQYHVDISESNEETLIIARGSSKKDNYLIKLPRKKGDKIMNIFKRKYDKLV